MKRRKFLILSSVLGLSSSLLGKNNSIVFSKSLKRVEKTIQSVQQHLFPEGSQIPSARSMNVTQFLLETITHPSYDKDIRLFVIEGAEELESREEGKFTAFSEKEKERALRAYEETHYGSNWLSRIMTLTMEGMFSDPIYGSNVKEAGWKALGSYGGLPRPTTRYIKL
ncbi:gluconate 2-dehydrogenase subunit 3 family protein [Sulfurovum sp. CS9]|uniref:gluconate 2-dehydrogenase subunit 3 family protein n=1 Tax=Sulfurovum sp. CS9 TaxID=3391146 RepID=UPI0039ED516A